MHRDAVHGSSGDRLSIPDDDLPPHLFGCSGLENIYETNMADACRRHRHQLNGWPRLSPWIGSSNELCHGSGPGVSDASDVSGYGSG